MIRFIEYRGESKILAYLVWAIEQCTSDGGVQLKT